jgi:hypothetical protein
MGLVFKLVECLVEVGDDIIDIVKGEVGTGGRVTKFHTGMQVFKGMDDAVGPRVLMSVVATHAFFVMQNLAMRGIGGPEGRSQGDAAKYRQCGQYKARFHGQVPFLFRRRRSI